MVSVPTDSLSWLSHLFFFFSLQADIIALTLQRPIPADELLQATLVVRDNENAFQRSTILAETFYAIVNALRDPQVSSGPRAVLIFSLVVCCSKLDDWLYNHPTTIPNYSGLFFDIIRYIASQNDFDYIPYPHESRREYSLCDWAEYMTHRLQQKEVDEELETELIEEIAWDDIVHRMLRTSQTIGLYVD